MESRDHYQDGLLAEQIHGVQAYCFTEASLIYQSIKRCVYVIPIKHSHKYITIISSAFNNTHQSRAGIRKSDQPEAGSGGEWVYSILHVLN